MTAPAALVRLGSFLAEGPPDCVSQALRIRNEAAVAFTNVAFSVDAFPAPDAEGVVEKSPVKPGAFGGARGHELAKRYGDAISAIEPVVHKGVKRLHACIHVCRDFVRIFSEGVRCMARRARNIPG